MSQLEKQTKSELHDGALYPEEEEKHKAALTPSSASDSDQEAFAGINEKAFVRKLDLKLLPAVTVLYLLSFLDRSNGRSSPPPTALSPSCSFHLSCQCASRGLGR